MAQLRTTLRQFSDAVGNGLGEDWQRALEEACRRDHDLLPDLLAEAIAATDLGFSRNPGWWRAVRGIQWFLLAVAMLGRGWLLANLLLAWVDLPGLVAPGDGGGMNIPALLIIGGVGGGLLFSFLSRGLVAAGERSGIRQVARRLRGAGTRRGSTDGGTRTPGRGSPIDTGSSGLVPVVKVMPDRCTPEWTIRRPTTALGVSFREEHHCRNVAAPSPALSQQKSAGILASGQD